MIKRDKLMRKSPIKIIITLILITNHGLLNNISCQFIVDIISTNVLYYLIMSFKNIMNKYMYEFIYNSLHSRPYFNNKGKFSWIHFPCGPK